MQKFNRYKTTETYEKKEKFQKHQTKKDFHTIRLRSEAS